MNDHITTIQRYYSGCNTADEDLMVSCFTEDVVHYFVDNPPVFGADKLAHYWAVVGPKTQATWNVDHSIAAGDEAVIEWSMRWLPPGNPKGGFERLRGTEWFRFRAGKISEIRSYHCNHLLNAPENRKLHGFDYLGRGYPGDPATEPS